MIESPLAGLLLGFFGALVIVLIVIGIRALAGYGDDDQ
jgi:hypothetical protein